MAGSLDYRRLGNACLWSATERLLISLVALSILWVIQMLFCSQCRLERATMPETAATKQQPSTCSFLYESCEYVIRKQLGPWDWHAILLTEVIVNGSVSHLADLSK